jgi:pyruvate dehydrogenase E2 component (dihydrolipoamide acetyltransferase)
MPTPITVPRLGWTMEEGVFVGWLKRDGDTIEPGDMVFELEGEKASQEIESLDGGVLRIPPDAPKPGDVVRVGAVLGYLFAPDESAESGLRIADCGLKGGPQLGDAQPPPFAPAASQSATRGPQSEITLAISPRARRVARELGVDWRTLRGGGRTGRIRERDVRAAAIATHTSTPVARPGGPPIPGRLMPLTPTRRTIARRMSAGVHEAAPVTLVTKADATNLVELRRRLGAATVAGASAPTYTDLLVKITAESLRQHPLLNAQWRDDGIFVPDVIHIAIAVDAPDGLVAPVVRDAARLSLATLAAESRRLVEAARRDALKAEDMSGATFTVSNLGPFGVDAFTPIVNPPQCAVLGVGRIVREPAVVGDQIVPRDMMALSLTFDHRIVDGAPAARFLNDVRRSVENPVGW